MEDIVKTAIFLETLFRRIMLNYCKQIISVITMAIYVSGIRYIIHVSDYNMITLR